MKRAALSCLVIAATLCLLGTAQATETRARELYEHAMLLIEAGEFEQARLELEQAYTESPHHVVLYNLGRVCLELADLDGARGYFERYLQEGGSQVPGERRAEVESILQELGQKQEPEPPAAQEPDVPSAKPAATPAASEARRAAQRATLLAKDPANCRSDCTDLLRQSTEHQRWRSVGITLSAVGAGLLATGVGVLVYNQQRAQRAREERQSLNGSQPATNIDAGDQEALDQVIAFERARTQNDADFASIYRFNLVGAITGITGGLLLGTGLTCFLLNEELPQVALGTSNVSLRFSF